MDKRHERPDQFPIQVFVGKWEPFVSIDDALRFAYNHPDENRSFLVRSELPELDVSVTGRPHDEIVTVRILDEIMHMKRSCGEFTDPGIVVSADPDGPDPKRVDTINISVGDYDSHPMLDRGMAWFVVGDPGNPRISFNIGSGSFSMEELQACYRESVIVASNYIGDIMNKRFPRDYYHD